MKYKFNLNKLIEDIRRDEGGAASSGKQQVSQDDIAKMIKARKAAKKKVSNNG